MELRSSRWVPLKTALPCGLLLGAGAWSAAPYLAPDLALPAALGALIVPPLIALLWFPTRLLARLDGAMLLLGDKSSRVADLVSVELQVVRANPVSVSRRLVFTFRAREHDSWAVKVSGKRKVCFSTKRIAGGRAAAERFANAVLAVGAGQPVGGPRHDPIPAPSAKPTGGRESFDPDATIARYLAGKTHAPQPVGRASFRRRRG